ncbi:cystathionine gamma-lyase [Modicisalibacter muralis]|uniref:Cystathionine gamma-lyase n=1 Tax=Modicisalibacter muralis TaxID=119000 RepID=A0A1G9G9Z0_9GAMM|nr:aminotransferase class I/II-fold pyridoxal phosphate-dependent enzyme [Halomonas muralis]SDK97371.1 cystathionine gamma-lyase [Halomonas muralis]
MQDNEVSSFTTRTVHGGDQRSVADNAIFPAIVTSSSFAKRGLDDVPDYAYGRVGNPTRHAYESCLAELEGGSGAIACASGMAATNAVLELLPKDSHILVMAGVYGGTFRLIEDYRGRTAGLEASYVDLNDIAALREQLRDNTRLIWIESPTNPLLELVDLERVARFARDHGLLTCIDNTFCSPWNQRPIEFGIDLVMHSASKYIGGHSDLIGGIVVAADTERLGELRSVAMATGSIQGPFDCYLALRGLKTLSLRMERQAANAETLARFLAEHPRVEAVFYPGLESHPQHELCRRQMRSGGAVVSMKLKAPREAFDTFLGKLKLFVLADSLGGVESMINHSYSMSHGSLNHEQKAAQGISENLFRLSVGIEDIEDLIAELDRALRAL